MTSWYCSALSQRTQQRLRCITFLLLTLLVLSCSERSVKLPHLAAGSTVLAFGDSLTFGSGVKEADSYPSVLEELTGLNVINEGNPGELSASGLTRLPKILTQHRPSLLILCHGGNDLLRKQSKDSLKQNLKAMIELSRSMGIPVVLLGVPEPKLLFMQSAPLYQQLAEEMQVPIDTEVLPKVENNAALKSDSIHPNAKGYRMMAEAIANLLKQSGAL